MNGGDIYRHTSALGELALQVCAGLAMAIGLEHVRHRTGSIVHDVGALVIAGLTFGGIVLGLWMVAQPAVHRRTGRRPVLQSRAARLRHPGGARHRAGACRRAACGPIAYRIVRGGHRGAADAELSVARGAQALSRAGAERRPTTDAEQYTYSVVWLAYGVALLLFGIAFRSQPARLASAAITLLTVAKVFLIDMAGLTGVFRALSFIGLGLVLVGIGWLYQRLLFPARPKTVTAPTRAPPLN